MEPLTAAIIDLRDRKDISQREKMLTLYVNLGTYALTMLTCMNREDVVAELRNWASLVESSGGGCRCGHHMSEGHMRHGNCFAPPQPTELAMEWTEKDQERAWSDGWLLLLDEKDLPYVVPVPEGRFNAYTPETMSSHVFSSHSVICRKAAALIERKRRPRV